MHLVDHQELTPPRMACPFRSTPDGRPAECMHERCALWYEATDHDYSGCSAFISAFYARGISYHVSRGHHPYHRRE